MFQNNGCPGKSAELGNMMFPTPVLVYPHLGSNRETDVL